MKMVIMVGNGTGPTNIWDVAIMQGANGYLMKEVAVTDQTGFYLC